MKKKINYKKLIGIIRILLFGVLIGITYSCGKEEFAANPVQQDSKTDPIKYSSSSLCSGHTLIKPPVDFLFLWDNSSGNRFINAQTKTALNNTINSIAYDRFDYRILMAPLLPVNAERHFLITENPNGLSTYAKSLIIESSQAANKLDTFLDLTGTGSEERGTQRAIDLIQQYHSHGVFRNGGYTMIILMSSENEAIKNADGNVGIDSEIYINEQINKLLCLRGNYSGTCTSSVNLNAKQMRFMSLVAHSSCGLGYTKGDSYIKVSKVLYNANYSNGNPTPTDQDSSSTPDSYNICTTNFTHLFDGINKSIKELILGHVYDYWPVADSDDAFDSSKIKLVKNTGIEILPKTDSNPNGYVFLEGVRTLETRRLPTRGESRTGYFVQLFGESEVKYPECILVSTQSPTNYYGYIQMHTKPVVSSIRLLINNIDIPQSATNGWEYIGYKDSQNIKIAGPNNYAEGTPAEIKTGYFLKLHGSAVYSNGAKLIISYDPQAN